MLTRPFISALVPAYNESKTIGVVLKALVDSPEIGEIIVIDDGSTDNTATIAAQYADTIVSLPVKSGKAAALRAGLEAAYGKHILMLDADLIGLKPEHVRQMVGAYAPNENQVIGVLKYRIPLISGQRVVPRSLLAAVLADTEGYEVEVALTIEGYRRWLFPRIVVLSGVSHLPKELKWPTEARGERLKMSSDMVERLLRELVLPRD